MKRRLSFGCFAVLLLTPHALAQPKLQVIKMTVSAAKLPSLAMKYHLLPELRDLKAGNAAVFYQRSQASDWWTPGFRQEVDKFYDMLEQPWQSSFAEKYPLLSGGPVKELDVAARYETCDWQMLDRLRADGPFTLIPDLQGMRNLARLNAGRTRIEVQRGDFDKAIRSFQSGFALSKHVGEAPLLINAFAGLGIADMTLSRVEEFTQQPEAPNLYWALTDLPNPFLDLRRPLQSERVFIDTIFPEVRKGLETGKPSPIPVEVLRRRLRQMAVVGFDVDSTALAVNVVQAYPAARAHFLRAGYNAQALDALPVTQVVLMHQYVQYDHWSDEFYKLNNIPYWEALPRWNQLQKKYDREVQNNNSAILLTRFRPWSHHVFMSSARVQRRIALLRCVEAIRHYAAANDHRLPESLDDLRETPIPLDPMTGKAFSYRVEAGQAILEAAALAADQNLGSAVRLEIQLAPISSK